MRDRESALVASGIRLMEEALRAGAHVEVALVSPRLDRGGRGRALRAALASSVETLVESSDAVIAGLLGAVRHEGVVARVRRPVPGPLPGPARPGARLVVAWGIQDPGNLGGILRAAAAAGAGGLLATAGAVDPWNPKAVRASAGASFRLPVRTVEDGESLLKELRAAGWRLIGGVPRGGRAYTAVDWRRPHALVLGGEAGGLPEEVVATLDERATIPMAGEMESLNVLSAATLLLFETARETAQPAPP